MISKEELFYRNLSRVEDTVMKFCIDFYLKTVNY